MSKKNNKFILTKKFLEESEKNFKNEESYNSYIKPLIEALGK